MTTRPNAEAYLRPYLGLADQNTDGTAQEAPVQIWAVRGILTALEQLREQYNRVLLGASGPLTLWWLDTGEFDYDPPKLHATEQLARNAAVEHWKHFNFPKDVEFAWLQEPDDDPDDADPTRGFELVAAGRKTGHRVRPLTVQGAQPSEDALWREPEAINTATGAPHHVTLAADGSFTIRHNLGCHRYGGRTHTERGPLICDLEDYLDHTDEDDRPTPGDYWVTVDVFGRSEEPVEAEWNPAVPALLRLSTDVVQLIRNSISVSLDKADVDQSYHPAEAAKHRQRAADFERLLTLIEPPAECARCKRPFDPADTRHDGAAQYADTAYCRGCIDNCHDNESAGHRCIICTPKAEP